MRPDDGVPEGDPEHRVAREDVAIVVEADEDALGIEPVPLLEAHDDDVEHRIEREDAVDQDSAGPSRTNP